MVSVLFITFVICLFIGVPVAFSLFPGSQHAHCHFLPKVLCRY